MILVMPQNFRDYWEGGTFSYIPSVQHPLWEFLPRSLEHSPWQAWYYHCSTSANAKVGFNRNPLMCLIMAPGQPPPPLLLLSPIINCRSLVLIQTFSTVFGSASALPTLYFYFIFFIFYGYCLLCPCVPNLSQPHSFSLTKTYSGTLSGIYSQTSLQGSPFSQQNIDPLNSEGQCLIPICPL